jgi:hypothetical protein
MDTFERWSQARYDGAEIADLVTEFGAKLAPSFYLDIQMCVFELLANSHARRWIWIG